MLAIVVLAAGKGTRMQSDLPKVLHPLCGVPLLQHVLRTAKALNPQRLIIIIGHGRDQVQREMAGQPVTWVVQEPQLGTGHAVKQTDSALADFTGDAIILSGDVPLLTAATLSRLVDAHRTSQAAATVLSTIAPDPTGYGRIIRDDNGDFVRIVEHRDATSQEKSVNEINSGIYCFNYKYLRTCLNELKADNSKSEYYLTDVIAILRKRNLPVQAVNFADFSEIRGINTVAELEAAESAVKSAFPSD